MFTLRLLGGLTLHGPSGPLSGRVAQRRRLALLALLGVAGEKGLSRDKLAGHLWAESDETHARHLISDSLYVLHRALGTDAIIAAGEFLRLNREAVSCDVAAFEEALAGGNLESAVRLYAGPFLDGFYVGAAGEFDAWVEAERERLADLYASALKSLAERAEAAKDYEAAAEWWKRLVAHDPYNSRAVLRVMQVLAAAGDRANALEHYRAHELRLREEFDIEPDEELRDLAEGLKKEALPGSPEVRPVRERPAPALRREAAEPVTGMDRVEVQPRGLSYRQLWRSIALYLVACWAALQLIEFVVGRYRHPEWVYGGSLVVLLLAAPLVLLTAISEALKQEEAVGGTQEPGTEWVTASARLARRVPFARHLTWPKTTGAVLVGLATMITAGTFSVIWGSGRLTEARGQAADAFGERDCIVVADFEGPEPALALAARELLVVDLQQSRYINVCSQRRMRDVLQRMEVPADSPIWADLAREIAVREGFKAVLLGKVTVLDGGYAVTARVEDPVDGRELIVVGARSGRQYLADGVERLSHELRARLGEALTEIEESRPLPQVTTYSLPALKKFALAEAASDRYAYDDAISFLKEAIALDPDFAAAHHVVAIEYWTTGRYADAERHLERAYDLRHKLTERRQYALEGVYNALVTGDLPAAIRSYRQLNEAYPECCLVNFGLFHAWLGDVEMFHRYAMRALELDPGNAKAYVNAAEAAMGLGRWSEAEHLAGPCSDVSPEMSARILARLHMERGDWTRAQSFNDSLLSEYGEPEQDYLRRAYARGATIATVRGQAKLALELLDKHRTLIELSDRLFDYAVNVYQTVFVTAELRADLPSARRFLAHAERTHPPEDLDPRPRAPTAWLYGRAHLLAGHIVRAEHYTQARYWHDRRDDHARRAQFQAEIALARKEFGQALDLGREAVISYYDYPLFIDHLIKARALEGLGQADSAIVYYERALSAFEASGYRNPWMERFLWQPFLHERLGDLYGGRGDRDLAVHHYEAFLGLWLHADSELQPQVEAVHERLQTLVTKSTLSEGPATGP